MHPLLVNRLIFPLHERLKGKPTHRRLRELEDSQWLSPEALQELQWARLHRHLDWAYRQVPYYTRLLDDHELPPRRVQSFENFARIPVLTKEILRDRFQDLQPRNRIRGVQRLSTGGSTGVPVTVLVDRERSAFTDATRLRAHRWFGADMGAREIVLWGSPIEVTRQDRMRAFRDRLLNSRLLSAFDLGEDALARYASLLQAYRPDKLYGYASALALLAGYLARTGWRGDGRWPRAIFTTAESLYDFQRALIESAFGCRAAVEYGCRDGGLIANEGPSGTPHIAAEGVLVEALGVRGDGAGSGELLVTNLHSFAMPIIRYRTGDMGALAEGPCACGRGLPGLSGVEGRQTDFLVTPRGRVMHALAVIYVLREVPAIRQFQVVQERLDRVVVRIVPAGEISDALRRTVAGRIAQLFDNAIAVDVETVEAIASPSGKHGEVISKVGEEYLAALTEAR